jgi:hypothetical protein
MQPANTIGEQIGPLRASAIAYPFDHRFRQASALALGNHAVGEDTDQWKRAALPELRLALQRDPTSPDLLAMAIAFDLAVGEVDEAKAYYEQFKQAAPMSVLPEWIKRGKPGVTTAD